MSLRDSVQVMVVDDMSTSRGLLTQALDQLGIQNYKTESNGRDALSKVLANPVHLVLSDLNMPDLDGLGLLQALRENPVTQRIGFILVTGSPNPDIVARGRVLGLNNLIKKPFTVQSMGACIEAVIGRL